MNEVNRSYQVVEFSEERRFMAAYQELKSGRHCMYALLEVDVTRIRQYIEEYKARTGETLSFTGYLAFCLGQAVDEDKTVQAYRKGWKQLVLFDDVDVGIMVELKQGEKRLLTGHVIQAANHKTFLEIHQEIRNVQSSEAPPSAASASWFRSAMLLPWPLSSLFKAAFNIMLRREPTLVTSMAGTVGISSVGMFGKGHAGWGISSGTHVLDLIVGGIAPRLAQMDGRIETRQVLSLTILFDHDVIDGAPAARFTRRLVELIENGYGLDEDECLSANDTEASVVQTEQAPV